MDVDSFEVDSKTLCDMRNKTSACQIRLRHDWANIHSILKCAYIVYDLHARTLTRGESVVPYYIVYDWLLIMTAELAH